MLLGMLLEADPTGEVNGVCWKLMGAIVVGAGLVVGWLVKRLAAQDTEIKELHKARLEDRKEFEAQSNVLVNRILQAKKGGSP